jgi:predicted ribosome quality control (RQC) complex YloA/Tae2 family protein
MMLKTFGLAVALATLSAVPAFAGFDECSAPIPPAAVDGSTATLAQVKAAHQDVVTFLKQSDDYQDCLNRALAEAADAAKKDKDKKPLDPEIIAQHDRLQKSNQSLKEKVGNEFNAAATAYNAKHPG